MKLVILSGMSGAGKTVALKQMEDIGFYCVDNLPISLMKQFAKLLQESEYAGKHAAVGIDIRSGDELSGFRDVLSAWKEEGIDYEIVFLEASDETLLKRFKETRRSHPLCPDGRIEEGIRLERERLLWLKEQSTYIIDTTRLLTKELRKQLGLIFENREAFRNLYLTVLSFGFKYGIPADADLVFDVRFLPNPYYDEALRPQTGVSMAVKEFVMQGGDGEAFLKKLFDLIEFLIPRYIQEGKTQLLIAMGCTGGKHRSVATAEALYEHLLSHREIGLKIEHRDILK